METMTTITSRKAIRSYTGKKPSKAVMDQILTAVQAAPVAMGSYDKFHVTIIENPDILKAIDAAGAKFFKKPDAHPLYGAPILILISAKPGMGPALGNADYASAGILVHNMALAATDQNVGNCYIWGAVMGMNQDADLVAKLNLPEGFIPCCGITLGETTETFTPRDIPAGRLAITEL